MQVTKYSRLLSAQTHVDG